MIILAVADATDPSIRPRWQDKIKAAIGHSPDFADSLLAAWWCRAHPPKPLFRVRAA